MGSTAADAGIVTTMTSIGSISIAGGINGGAGAGSGAITTGTSAIGNIGSIKLGGSLTGGAGANSGVIMAGADNPGESSVISAVTITGGIVGGSGDGSGVLSAGGTGADETGSIGSVTIGTGITGGAGMGSGLLSVMTGSGYGGKLTSLSIAKGGITGGGVSGGTGSNGADSGQVSVDGAIGSLNLHGAALTGGYGDSSGLIVGADSLGSLSLGSLVSGSGTGSGEISTQGNLTSLTFSGAPSSATSVDTGLVNVSGSAGSITVTGNIGGVAAGENSGLFLIGGGAKSISITGSLVGGAGQNSGAIFAGLDDSSVIGSLTVTGGIIGGSGAGSGEVFGGGGVTKASLGDIVGGGGQSSGSLVSDYAIGAVTITGKGAGGMVNNSTVHGIVGGAGVDSGQISAGATIGSVKVTGSLQGNTGAGSGDILSHSLFTATGDTQGDIGSISISGGITAYIDTVDASDTTVLAGANSAQIDAAGNINSLTVGGSVAGGFANGTGAILAGTDLIGSTGGNINTLNIGSLVGPAIPQNMTLEGSGYIEAGHIGTLTAGYIQAGAAAAGATFSDVGAILAANDIGSLTVTGEAPNTTDGIDGTSSNPVVISAVGQLNPGKTDLAIGKIAVAQAVTYTDFLAGYNQSGNSPGIGVPALNQFADVNGAASIGPVTVGGSWSGSNLVAGVNHGAPGSFTGGASLISSAGNLIPSIASIIIKGNVTATGSDGPDTYGFLAQKIGTFIVDGKTQTFLIGTDNNVDGAGDTDAREVT